MFATYKVASSVEELGTHNCACGMVTDSLTREPIVGDDAGDVADKQPPGMLKLQPHTVSVTASVALVVPD